MFRRVAAWCLSLIRPPTGSRAPPALEPEESLERLRRRIDAGRHLLLRRLAEDTEAARSNDEPPLDQPEHPERSPEVIGCAVLVGALFGAGVGLGLAYLLFTFLPKLMSLDFEGSLN